MTHEHQQKLLAIAKRLSSDPIGNRSCLVSRAAFEDLQRLLAEISRAEPLVAEEAEYMDDW